MARGTRRDPAAFARGLSLPIAAFVASRVVIALSIAATLLLRPGLTFRQAVTAWDVGWYVTVASGGYPAHAAMHNGRVGQSVHAFFPLFPLLERWLAHYTSLSLLSAGIVIALLGGAVSAVLLRWLIATISGDEVADRAVVFFCFFPSSFILFIGYSEAVMLPFAMGCLIALIRRRWVLAGLCAAVATAARPNALALCLACLFASLVAIRNDRAWRSLVAPLLSGGGLLAFMAFLWARTGDPMVVWKAQRYGWEQRIDFGHTTLTRLFDVLHRPFDVNVVVSALSVVFVIVAVVLLLQWRPPGVLIVYALFVIGVPLASAAISSRPRFALTAFPLIAAVAWRARGAAFAVVVATSGALLAALTIVTLGSLAATP
jgi:hypothetical protein